VGLLARIIREADRFGEQSTKTVRGKRAIPSRSSAEAGPAFVRDPKCRSSHGSNIPSPVIVTGAETRNGVAGFKTARVRGVAMVSVVDRGKKDSFVDGSGVWPEAGKTWYGLTVK
jgi:hypothetical protein